MKGKAVVVAGGAGGLGRATIEMMLKRGTRGVAIIDADGDSLGQAVAGFEDAGFDVLGIEGDITLSASAEPLFAQAVAAFERIDVLVNCAGIYPRVPILEISDQNWIDSCAVNIRGTHNMMAAAVKHMRPHREGRIVNISSVNAFKAQPQNAHYAATKAAVVSA